MNRNGQSSVPVITGPQYAIEGAVTPATPFIQNSRNWYNASNAKTVADSCDNGNTRISR
mgnify:CR=1 FL=1